MAGTTRADKAADKVAADILASLSVAGVAAIEQTIEDTVRILRADTGLLYHLNALLHNSEWTAVLKASLEVSPSAGSSGGDKPAEKEKEGRKLRANVTKFVHLCKRRGQKKNPTS